jgi:hypothetical protein
MVDFRKEIDKGNKMDWMMITIDYTDHSPVPYGFFRIPVPDP